MMSNAKRAGDAAGNFSTKMRRIMHDCSGKLLAHIEEAERAAVWTSSPPDIGWYIWKAKKDGIVTTIYIDVKGKNFFSPSGIDPFAEDGLWFKFASEG